MIKTSRQVSLKIYFTNEKKIQYNLSLYNNIKLKSHSNIQRIVLFPAV